MLEPLTSSKVLLTRISPMHVLTGAFLAESSMDQRVCPLFPVLQELAQREVGDQVIIRAMPLPTMVGLRRPFKVLARDPTANYGQNKYTIIIITSGEDHARTFSGYDRREWGCTACLRQATLAVS